jgi:hypothetical protein
MTSPLHRRDFIKGFSTAAALAGLGDYAFLKGLPALSAADVQVRPTMVQLSPDIEPLVRLLEETPRDRLVAEAARRVRGGTSYQQLLSALMLAGVRNVRPRPVGFQFHTVLAVNSVHLASIAAQDRDRWLPLFWGLDNFKVSQARNQQVGGWVMPALDESRLPPAHQARQRFVEAMDNWNEEGADLAIAAYVRSAGTTEIIEHFWRYGARDFRDIGHKAIFVANGYRTLQTIGWRHAEPVLRSLAFALLEHEGDNPAQRDDDRDRPWRENLQKARRIRERWQRGRISAEATTDLLAAMRTASAAESCDRVVQMLNNEVDPASIWDALFLMAGELLMRQPGIVGVHCVTSANALYYGYQTSGNDETRRMLMLQATAFLPLFREAMRQRGRLRDDVRIDTLEPLEPTSRSDEAVAEIFTDVSQDKMRAARKTLALLQGDSAARAEAVIAAGRRLIFHKGDNSHDYKFSSAALEDFYHTTPAWRNRYLATSMFNLRGAEDRDNALIQRTREALGSA